VNQPVITPEEPKTNYLIIWWNSFGVFNGPITHPMCNRYFGISGGAVFNGKGEYVDIKL
jgi:hypothetical protein